MANLEERVIVLEVQAEAQTRAIDGLRQEIAELRVELRANDMALRNDLTALRTEIGGEMVELRSEMSRRFDLMDQKFIWLAGTQVATLLAVVGVLAGALYR